MDVGDRESRDRIVLRRGESGRHVAFDTSHAVESLPAAVRDTVSGHEERMPHSRARP